MLIRDYTSDQYNVFPIRASLEMLCDTNDIGIPNIQLFEGFNYPLLKRTIQGNVIRFSNDSIEFDIFIAPFDTLSFLHNYTLDSSLYYKSLYFREDLDEKIDVPRFLPEKEIREIKLTIKGISSEIESKVLNGLYDPNIDCWTIYNEEKCGINVHISDNKKILLHINGGAGASAYIAIFQFDENGNIENRLFEPTI
ncbi:MAG: hypothetical protein ACOYXB_11635 [Bacteroidota bacterium]